LRCTARRYVRHIVATAQPVPRLHLHSRATEHAGVRGASECRTPRGGGPSPRRSPITRRTPRPERHRIRGSCDVPRIVLRTLALNPPSAPARRRGDREQRGAGGERSVRGGSPASHPGRESLQPCEWADTPAVLIHSLPPCSSYHKPLFPRCSFCVGGRRGTQTHRKRPRCSDRRLRPGEFLGANVRKCKHFKREPCDGA